MERRVHRRRRDRSDRVARRSCERRPVVGWRTGKSQRPDGGSPQVDDGDAARRAIDSARRSTLPRRQLARHERFEQVSPEVGELDEEAFDAALGEDPDAALGLLADLTSATDPRLRALARRLAARIFIDLARQGETRAGGTGRLTELPYEPDRGDLDLDASLEPIVDARAGLGLDADRLRVRGWSTPRTAVCLLVDRSGSMGGQPLAANALAASALALRSPDAWGVLSFASRVIALKPLVAEGSAEQVIDDILALRGYGTTDLAGALTAAARQFDSTRATRRLTVLLSDCRATEPGDVVASAAALDELAIVAPAGDDTAARTLATAVGARFTTIDGPTGIPAALASVLTR